jgi:hypothetical protein
MIEIEPDAPVTVYELPQTVMPTQVGIHVFLDPRRDDVDGLPAQAMTDRRSSRHEAP